MSKVPNHIVIDLPFPGINNLYIEELGPAVINDYLIGDPHGQEVSCAISCLLELEHSSQVPRKLDYLINLAEVMRETLANNNTLQVVKGQLSDNAYVHYLERVTDHTGLLQVELIEPEVTP